MLKRSLYSLFVAFALLIAQQGAAWHALSHVRGEMVSSGQHDKKLPNSEQCEKCAVFSQLGAALAATAPQITLAAFSDVLLGKEAPLFRVFERQPYQPRAPPVLA